MFKTNTNNVIVGIVDQVLDRSFTAVKYFTHGESSRGAIQAPGLLFELKLKVKDNYSGRETFEEFCLIFSGNTSVWYAKKKGRFCKNIPVDEWVNTSNHDTCWRSDGMNFLESAYFNMCERVNHEVAPCSLEVEAKIGFIKLFRYVMVSHAEGGGHHRYERKIIKVKIK